MPRIEIIPNGWEGSEEQKAGNGTPTIDTCLGCSDDFTEGELLSDSTAPSKLLKEYPGSVIGSTSVEHPQYEDSAEMGLRRDCECCEVALTAKDD